MPSKAPMSIPATDEQYPHLDVVLSSIRMYADEHKLTPPQVADLFHAGIAACHVLRPAWVSGGDTTTVKAANA